MSRYKVEIFRHSPDHREFEDFLNSYAEELSEYDYKDIIKVNNNRWVVIFERRT